MDDEIVKREYLIEAKKEQLNIIEKFFQYVQLLGHIGASRKVELFIDGDGQVQFKFYKKVNDNFVRIDQTQLDDDIGYGFIKTKNEDIHYFSLG